MAGQFEIFTDAESNVRFRLVGADGTVLVISKPFPDIRSAAEGIRAVRECAGTGLITQDHPDPISQDPISQDLIGRDHPAPTSQDRPNPWGGSRRPRKAIPPLAHHRNRHAPV